MKSLLYPTIDLGPIQIVDCQISFLFRTHHNNSELRHSTGKDLVFNITSSYHSIIAENLTKMILVRITTKLFQRTTYLQCNSFNNKNNLFLFLNTVRLDTFIKSTLFRFAHNEFGTLILTKIWIET